MHYINDAYSYVDYCHMPHPPFYTCTFLFIEAVVLTGPFAHRYLKIYPGLLAYSFEGLPCHWSFVEKTSDARVKPEVSS